MVDDRSSDSDSEIKEMKFRMDRKDTSLKEVIEPKGNLLENVASSKN